MQKVIIVCISFLILAACTSDQSNGELSLNDGEKWKVNTEMKPHVDRGQTALETYISEGRTDYKQLAENLKASNEKLIKSCTMEGKSHEELHKWLHPHMQLIQELEEADNQEEASLVIEKIEQSYSTYEAYFQ